MDALFEMMEETNQLNSRTMESGLLSSFHDDHFDGNYSKYDHNLGLWSDGNDIMGLQLSETLHGILPIAANEEAPHFFGTEVEHRISHRLDRETDGLNETVIEMDEENYVRTNYNLDEDLSDSMSPSIEIISVDPNCDFSSPVTIDDEDGDDESDSSSDSDNEEVAPSIGDYESQSNAENDAECVEAKISEHFNGEHAITKIKQEYYLEPPLKKIESEHGLPSARNHLHANQCRGTKFQSNMDEHIEILETEVVDMKNFDLAAYITQDDYDFAEPQMSGLLLPEKLHESNFNNTLSNSTNSSYIVGNIKAEFKCDSDTEAIIDIETVHENDEDVKPMSLRKQTFNYSENIELYENVAHCEDDIKHDPSWSPNNGKSLKGNKTKNNRQPKNKKNNNLVTQCNRMLGAVCTVPNSQPKKSHVVMDRKKYGLGKGKNISMCAKPEWSNASDSSENEEEKKPVTRNEYKPIINYDNNNQNSAIDVDKDSAKFQISKHVKTDTLKAKTTDNVNAKILIPKTEIKTEEVHNEIKIEPTTESKAEKTIPENIDHNYNRNKNAITQINVEQKNAEVQRTAPVKKKLNLEEYKRRRENQLIGDTKIKKCLPYDPIKTENSATNKKEDTKTLGSSQPISVNLQCNKLLATKPLQRDSSTNIQKGFNDPILEAKRKVLRMQELKKAAQSKRIDSAVSAKVGPITPILPLEQICNVNYRGQANSTSKLNPEYEEIIIVSASCNTEISLPPVFEKCYPNSVAPCNDSPLTAVIKSSSLLSNINDKFKKSSTVRISSSSLLSSIQDVVLKQSTTSLLNGSQLSQKSPNIGVSPPSQFSPQKPEMSHTDQNNTLSLGKEKTGDANPTILEHGEDKIIMHLRKDRIRKKTFSIAVQTEELPQFPALMLLKAEKQSNGQCSNPKKRKRHYRSRRNSSSSSVDHDDYRSSSRSNTRYRSVSSQGTNRSISPRGSRYSYSSSRRSVSPYQKVSRRSSTSTSRTKYPSGSSSDSDSGRRSRSRARRTRRYSSSHSSSSSSSNSSGSERSSRSRSRSHSHRSRSRSRSRYSSAHRQRGTSFRRNSSPAVEERRIVYVGRIERETSKEDLKRKFSAYGPIRQITVHYKDTGMKYGFVTFEKAQDAYAVIDCSISDSRINMYDISFGGRRAFCRATYSDLDGAATNSLQDLPYSMAVPQRPKQYQEDSFESLLAKVKEKLSTAKPSSSPASTSESSRCKT